MKVGKIKFTRLFCNDSIDMLGIIERDSISLDESLPFYIRKFYTDKQRFYICIDVSKYYELINDYIEIDMDKIFKIIKSSLKSEYNMNEIVFHMYITGSVWLDYCIWDVEFTNDCEYITVAEWIIKGILE